LKYPSCNKVVLISILLLLVLLFGCGKNYNATQKGSIETIKNEVKIISDERINELYPGWILLRKEAINLNGDNYGIIGLARTKNQFTANVRLCILKLIDNQWLEVWRIPLDLESESFGENRLREKPDNNLKDLLIVDDNNSALVVANVLVGGNHGTTQVLAFTINQIRNEYALKLFDSSGLMKINKDGKYILIEGQGKYGIHKVYLENGEFKEDIINRSNTNSSESINASFVLSDNGNLIFPSESSNMTMQVGQTIAFIPANAKTKQAFDNGEIEIYTDAWNEPPLTICEANKISSGNSYTFDKAGTVHFLLVSTKNKHYINNGNIQPTFTVLVKP